MFLTKIRFLGCGFLFTCGNLFDFDILLFYSDFFFKMVLPIDSNSFLDLTFLFFQRKFFELCQ